MYQFYILIILKMSNIYKKLNKFKQKNIKLKKDTKGYWYKYATLEQIQDKVNPILNDLGLILIDKTIEQKVRTELIDIDTWDKIYSELEIWEVQTYRKEIREWKKDIETEETNSLDPQWVWSVITYYRRYNRVQLLDLEQEDDDWYSGSGRARSKAKNYNKSNTEKDKEWLNDLDKDIKGGKQTILDNYDNARDAVIALRKKFKVSKKMAKQVKDLYT